MGDSHAPEFQVNRNNYSNISGKKKKRKVKKKVKRNLVPPSKYDFVSGDYSEIMFEGHTDE